MGHTSLIMTFFQLKIWYVLLDFMFDKNTPFDSTQPFPGEVLEAQWSLGWKQNSNCNDLCELFFLKHLIYLIFIDFPLLTQSSKPRAY